ncbi:MAG: LLM class F420-dependent oxidoreductase [Gammaproteobacteria bacterium]|nr:LLM class F420-dependent oxidoreductase [Gammaproteobacteria bacterium]MCY4277559.1 LLM class F420-dependent oxidoreductase [Gammaproteobacteria bacterium]
MTAFGVLIFPTDYSISPAELAVMVEERGFESMFFPEHTHIPASRISPWPGGADLPKQYWHTHDPFVGLAMAAQATRRIMLGTGIALVTERDPILMAKQAATLDFLSEGRLALGVGAGWNAEEMENHGARFADRWKILRERILAMKCIWNDDEAEYHGEFVDFDPIWAYPKPKRPGGPKIFMGAGSSWTWGRIAEYCDGWMPIYQDPDQEVGRKSIDFPTGMQKVREAWDAAGRDGEPEFTVYGMPGDKSKVDVMINFGFNRLLFGLPSAGRDKIEPILDSYAKLLESF